MAVEIERKFLVVDDRWREQAHQVVPMAQGYLNDQAAMDTGRDTWSLTRTGAAGYPCPIGPDHRQPPEPHTIRTSREPRSAPERR